MRMKNYDDITPALSAILRSWAPREGMRCWVGFRVEREGLPGIRAKWLEDFGTGLDGAKRRWRRRKKLPTAWACSLPVLGMPHQAECVLLATERALAMTCGPFSRQEWNTRPPIVSDFVMVKEPRDRRDYCWTWRIQDRVLHSVQRHLIALVTERDGAELAKVSHQLIGLYPMFGGVRRQLRRTFRGAEALWNRSAKSSWPGPDPEHLPMMIGFKRDP
jgi:hypothetical protein